MFSVAVEVGVKYPEMCFNCNTHGVHEMNKIPWEQLWREGRKRTQIQREKRNKEG